MGVSVSSFGQELLSRPQILELFTLEMMLKTNEERNAYQKTKYHQRKAKQNQIKNLLTIILVSLILLLLWSWNDNRSANASTEQSIQGVRDEINSFRKDVQSQLNAVGGKLQEQDKKIEGIRQSKADQKQRESIILAAQQRSNVDGGCEQYRPLVAQYSWNVDTALAVMKAESGCNTNAVSPLNYDGLRDYGLMQLHGQAVFDPAQNLAIAWQKYQARGWQPWTVCTKGIVTCI